jgi:hypothetical protein
MRITVKRETSLLSCEEASALEEAIRAFAGYRNCERYREALGDVTPFDGYTGWRQEILERREAKQSRTLEERRGYPSTVGGQGLVAGVVASPKVRLYPFLQTAFSPIFDFPTLDARWSLPRPGLDGRTNIT